MEAWQRNLYVIWVSQLVAIIGFSVVFPFLPYYVQELGVTELHQVELWSGVLFATQAVTMAIFAPIWGALSDRYGRKLMVQRAMFGGAVTLAAMGFAQNVWQLAVLRAIQGMLTGTVAAATTLVASSTPRERSGYALGLLQMAIWTGASLGPLLGGLVADTWGYRAAFWVTGILLFLAGLTVWRFVEEDFEPPTRDKDSSGGGFWEGVRLVVRQRPLISLFSIRFIVRLGVRLIGPVLPLFVQSLVPPTARLATITGLISGVQAGASAIGAVTLGRASDRIGYRRVLLACTVAGAILYVPQFFVTTPWQLLILQGSGGSGDEWRAGLHQRSSGDTGPGGTSGRRLWRGCQRRLGGQCRGTNARCEHCGHGRLAGAIPSDSRGACPGSRAGLALGARERTREKPHRPGLSDGAIEEPGDSGATAVCCRRRSSRRRRPCCPVPLQCGATG